MNVYNNEKMEEECGVFAMYSPVLRSDLAPLTYYGLYALQHRGQESAGMTLCDSFGENRVRHKTIKGMGLVSEVFSVEDLRSYTNNIVIGHVRYSTTRAGEGLYKNISGNTNQNIFKNGVKYFK